MAAAGGILFLALLHPGLALLGHLLLLRLALARRSRPLLQSLATLLRAGTGGIGFRCRWHGARQSGGRFLRVGFPRCNAGRHIGRAGSLAHFNALQPLCSPLASFLLVHHGLLLAQNSQFIARLAACRPQTVFHGKALVAGSLRALQGLVNGLTLVADAFAFSSAILRLRWHRRRSHRRAHIGCLRTGQGCQKKRQRPTSRKSEKTLHVSPVSTTRRSSARNSLDCISLRRDTVRGNSWASGPSV